MPDTKSRYHKALERHKKEVLNWVVRASGDEKLNFLEHYLLSFNLEELEKCFNVMQSLLENLCVIPGDVTKASLSALPKTDTPQFSRNSKQTTVSGVNTEEFKAKTSFNNSKSANVAFEQRKPPNSSTTVEEDLQNLARKLAGANVNIVKDSVVSKDLTDIREFIKSSVSASWLVEENLGQLPSPTLQDVCPEGFELVLAFRIDDSLEVSGNVGVAGNQLNEEFSVPKSEYLTKKRKRKGKSGKSDPRKEELQEQCIVTADKCQELDNKYQKISHEAGGHHSKPFTPNRIPLGELQSPPAKRPRQANSKVKVTSHRNMVLSPSYLPVHKGLLKIKLESDFCQINTKPEPID